MKKRILTVILAGMVAVGGMIVYVDPTYKEVIAANNTIVSPCYETLLTAMAGLTISDSTAKCVTKVTTKVSSPIKIKMHLKKQVGTSWEIVQTWNSSLTNATASTLQKSCAVSSGTYRVYSIITVDGEEVVRTSSIVTK